MSETVIAFDGGDYTEVETSLDSIAFQLEQNGFKAVSVIDKIKTFIVPNNYLILDFN